MSPTPTVPMHRHWNNQQVVRERDRSGFRWLGSVTLCFLVVATPVSLHLLKQNECLKLTYENNRLRTRLEKLTERQQRLAMRRARLESLHAVDAWAIEEGGLIVPDRDEILILSVEPGAGRRRGHDDSLGSRGSGASTREEH